MLLTIIQLCKLETKERIPQFFPSSLPGVTYGHMSLKSSASLHLCCCPLGPSNKLHSWYHVSPENLYQDLLSTLPSSPLLVPRIHQGSFCFRSLTWTTYCLHDTHPNLYSLQLQFKDYFPSKDFTDLQTWSDSPFIGILSAFCISTSWHLLQCVITFMSLWLLSSP